MPTKKYLYFTIPTALNGVDTYINAGAGLNSLGDDFKQRTITGIQTTNATALVQLFIRSKTKKIGQWPCTAFSATRGPLPVNYRYAPTILFDVGVTNASGGTVNNIEGYIEYEVPTEEDQ